VGILCLEFLNFSRASKGGVGCAHMVERPEEKGQAHPARETLHRFLHGEAAGTENRAVVRHLLTGCPQCIAMVRPNWTATDRLGGRRIPRSLLARRQRALQL
jgi:hypothetical protein